MADKASNEPERRAWLEMAESWSFLTKLEDAPSEGFGPAPRDDAEDRSDIDHQLGPIILEIKKQCASIAVALGKAANVIGLRLGPLLFRALDRIGIARRWTARDSKHRLELAVPSRGPQQEPDSKSPKTHSERREQPAVGLSRDGRVSSRF